MEHNFMKYVIALCILSAENDVELEWLYEKVQERDFKRLEEYFASKCDYFVDRVFCRGEWHNTKNIEINEKAADFIYEYNKNKNLKHVKETVEFFNERSDGGW